MSSQHWMYCGRSTSSSIEASFNFRNFDNKFSAIVILNTDDIFDLTVLLRFILMAVHTTEITKIKSVATFELQFMTEAFRIVISSHGLSVFELTDI